MDWEPNSPLNWRATVDQDMEMLDAPDPLDYALAQLLGITIEPKDPKKVSGAAWDYALDQLLGPYWLPEECSRSIFPAGKGGERGQGPPG
ncbi:MAG: hypothetical protein Q9187_000354 [Circinaria calcarea]